MEYHVFAYFSISALGAEYDIHVHVFLDVFYVSKICQHNLHISQFVPYERNKPTQFAYFSIRSL